MAGVNFATNRGTGFDAMIRRAKPADVAAVIELAQRAALRIDTGSIVVSPARIAAAALRLISEPQSLVLVHESEGAVNGVIAVGVSDALWFERKIAGIVLWYAEAPRSGYAMLRHALAWCAHRPAIKAVGFSEDFAWDPRISTLLERAGLKRRGSVYAR